ncbi:MAG: cytochrome P450 [Acidimicrobiales bacterium]
MSIVVADFDPFDPLVAADPYPWYSLLRRDAPVHHVASHDLWVVSRYEHVRTVLGDTSTFSNEAMAAAVSRPSLRTGEEPDAISIIGLDGDDHTRLRRIVNRGFTPRRVAELADMVSATVDELLSPVRGRGPFDLVTELAVPVPNRVIAAMLGVDVAVQADFGRWAEVMVGVVFDPDGVGVDDALESASDQMNEWLDEAMAKIDADSGDDLVSVLMRAEDDDVLTTSEMRVFVFTLLVAGSFTSRHLISNTVRALLDHPDQLQAIIDDPGLIDAVVEEGLRYDSPAQWMLRTAMVDVDIDGTSIPAGATVLGLIGSANRDEAVFVDADRFILDRPSGDHLAFGHGAHYCLGAAVARLEVRITLGALLADIESVRQTGPAERLDSFAFRGLRHLPIEIT